MSRKKIVDTVPTPEVENYEENFNRFFNSLLDILKSIDFEQFKEQNWITLPDETLLSIEDYIIELSKPEYKNFLKKIKIPNRPTKSPNNKETDFEKKLKESDFNIRCMYYIKELIFVYSIYHNHQNRNYFFALCSHITAAYSRRHPDEDIQVVFRFKSPKGLILKLAKKIFLKGYFHRDPSTGTDTFKYESLNDVFGFKLIAKKGFSPTDSSIDEIQNIINKKNSFYKKIREFDSFLETLNIDPSSITTGEYLGMCKKVLISIKDDTIHKEETQLIKYLEETIKKINVILNDLDLTDSLSSPLSAEIVETFKFKNWLSKYKRRLDAPLNLKGLKNGIKSILKPPKIVLYDINYLENTITKYFNTSIIGEEEKHTSSGHEGIHYDIQTPLRKS